MKIRILGTGLSGLVGRRIVELLAPDFEFVNLSREAGIDITNATLVKQKIAQESASLILHLAAKADVEGCEKDKALGEKGQAWQINVMGTENTVKAAHEFGLKVIYISTDFVFDGEKEFYQEGDQPHPINWYGATKAAAEKLVGQYPKNLIVRIAYPYKTQPDRKKDFLHAIAGQLASEKEVFGLTDHYFTPTFVDDLALALKRLIIADASGIYHVVGSSYLTPFAAAGEIAATFGYNAELVKPTTRREYFQGRAPRPYKLQLKNDKIVSLGVVMHTFTQALAITKKQGFTL